jgi:hypothetical protein
MLKFFSNISSYFSGCKKNSDPITITNHLDTLDIVLCNGHRYWFSYVVEYATWSDFSHIGIILKSPTWIDPGLTGTYFLESGIETFPDSIDHKMKYGVQICDFNHMLEIYNGSLYVKKVDSVAFNDNREFYINKLKKIYESIKDKPYDDNPIDLLEAQIRVRLKNANRIDSFFCSALVAFVFTQLGFLPADTEWDLFQPKDFADGNAAERYLNQIGFAKLEKMIRIK